MYYIDGIYNGIPSYKYLNENCDKEYNTIIIDNKKILTGIKWECIEFIRRYLSKKYNISFSMVKNVYDMLNIKYFIDFLKNKLVFLEFYCKNCIISPKVDDLVLFYYKNTGHIAIISKIKNKYIEICEQNWSKDWETTKYSRIVSINDPNIICFLRFL